MLAFAGTFRPTKIPAKLVTLVCLRTVKTNWRYAVIKLTYSLITSFEKLLKQLFIILLKNGRFFGISQNGKTSSSDLRIECSAAERLSNFYSSRCVRRARDVGSTVVAVTDIRVMEQLAQRPAKPP